MRCLRSLAIAFSMYTRIPMPHVAWDKDSMRGVLCFFPLCGLAVAAALALWDMAADWLQLGDLLRAAGFAVLPVAVTGGIHLDGFCDTADALASHQEREEKLRILRDSRIGAFAVIALCLYFLMQFALWCELKTDEKTLILLCCMCVLSRGMSALSLVTLPCARKDGLAFLFADAAGKRRARLPIGAVIAAAGLAAVCCSPAQGAAMLGALAICAAVCWRKFVRDFGGMTGDLAGFFLQCAELAMLAAITVTQKF